MVGRALVASFRCHNIFVGGVIKIRTKISLLEPECKAVKVEAKRLGNSQKELPRRSVGTVIPADESKPWMRYAGLVKSGDSNSSRDIDDVIYGQKP